MHTLQSDIFSVPFRPIPRLDGTIAERLQRSPIAQEIVSKHRKSIRGHRSHSGRMVIITVETPRSFEH